MSKHVVVIGAGPGGLASAMLLARAGLRVTVLERRGSVGGRCSAIEARGSGDARFRFDMGPTFFLYPQVLEEIFAACGYDLHEEVDLVRLDPQYRLVFEGGGELSCSPEVERMRREIAKLCLADADRFGAFLDENRRKFAAFKPILQRPWDSPLDLLRFNPRTMLPLVRPWSSVDRDLRRHFRDERVRLAFSFQSKYLGMSPFKCPSLFTILSFLEYEYGVWHPRGGCAAISETMARLAEGMGADIRLDEPVERMLFDGNRATGVVTNRGEIAADAVVINADFAAAMTKLVPDRIRRRWTDRRLAKRKFSCSTFMMYLGIDGRYDDLAHHTIFLAKDYAQNLREIERDHVLSANPSVYVQNPCVTDDTLASPGTSTLYVLAPVTNLKSRFDWEREAPRFRRTVLDQLAKFGIRDLEARIRFEKVFTPRSWEGEMNVHLGATFNLAHGLDQMLHLRPRNRFEDLRGVYLVGGGTHPGSGLPVIYEGARISSRLLLEDLGVPAVDDAALPLRQPQVLPEVAPGLVEAAG